MGVTEQLARFAVETELTQVPEHVIEETKIRILDTIAVMVVGSQFESARLAASFVEDLGSRPDCGLVGRSIRAASPYAAFANGVAAHSPEFDDTWIGSNGGGGNHISACVLPAALAVGESRGASGKDLLLAYILGFEIAARMGMVPPRESIGGIIQGYHPTPLLAVFGVGVAGAKLLGLDVEQVRCTMGLIGSEGGGLRKQAGTMAKSFQAGHAARNGVVAALLAAKGFTADRDILEGEPGTGHDHFGYYETHFRDLDYDLEAATRDLGSDWDIMYTVTKLHPGYIHAASVDLTLDMVREHDIRPEQVEKVEVGVTSMVNLGPTYRYPLNALHSRFSQWYNIAVCILDRQAGLTQFTEERLGQPDVAPLLEKVHFYLDQECDEEYKSGEDLMGSGCKVSFRLTDGRTISRKERSRPGYLDNRAKWSDIVGKLEECVEFSGLAEQGLRVERVVHLVSNIDELPQISELMEALRV